MASIFDELTPQWLKDTFLVGVDLTLDDGTDYPDVLYEQALRGAVATLEHELSIKIDGATIFEEKHDAFDQNRDAWWPFRLDHRPLRSVSGFRIKYGSYEAVEFPLGWLQIVSPEHGQIHLIPSGEQLGAYRYRVGIPILIGDVFAPRSYIPGYFEFDYEAGFALETGSVVFAAGETEKALLFDTALLMTEYRVTTTATTLDEEDEVIAFTGTVTPSLVRKTGFKLTIAAQAKDVTVTWLASSIPADLKQCVGLLAATLPLDVAGDLIAGAGIASISIGADGLHQSINTTSSATNSGYGARVLQFERELKRLIPALRSKYKAMNFGVI